MANQLKMAMVETVLRLLQQGWSYRRIARELGIHRNTVSELARKSKPAKAPLGAEHAGSESKPAKAPLGADPLTEAVVTLDAEGARTRAQEADAALARGESWGPLHGVPITIKDSFQTQGRQS